MSLVDSHPADRRIDPSMTLPLPSPPIATNNPFRRGNNSPSLLSPSERSSILNPFLDPSMMPSAPVTSMPASAAAIANANGEGEVRQPQIRSGSVPRPGTSPQKFAPRAPGMMGPPPPRPDNTGMAGLSLGPRPPPPQGRGGPPPYGHRPSNSQDRTPGLPDARRPLPNDGLAFFRGPAARPLQPPGQPLKMSQPSPERRPRRNSESSVSGNRSLEFDEERRRRERKQREKERIEGKKDDKDKKSGSRKGTNRALDVIDKLDVTNVLGQVAFHHDGPFDACNPHRNRRGATRAPMEAFPANSKNNTMGGSGPLKKNIDLAQFHGHGVDSFTEYNNAAVAASAPTAPTRPSEEGASPDVYTTRPNPDVVGFDPTAKTEYLHGEQTLGLGSTTFLEGTPAPRKLVERRDSEGEAMNNGGGLSRKKSLAMRLKGLGGERPSGPRRNTSGMSPEPIYEPGYAPQQSSALRSPPMSMRPLNAELNPFDDMKATGSTGVSGTENLKKGGTTIRIAEDNNVDAERSQSVAVSQGTTLRETYALERAITDDSSFAVAKNNRVRAMSGTGSGSGSGEDEPKKGGFLNRVRSLRTGGGERGGRRGRVPT